MVSGLHLLEETQQVKAGAIVFKTTRLLLLSAHLLHQL